MTLVLGLLVFTGVLGIVLGGYWFFILRLEDVEEKALRKRLKGRRASVAVPVAKAEERKSSFGPLDALFDRSEILVRPIEREIALSGASWTVGQVMLASLLLAGVTAAVVFQFSSSLWLAGIAGLLGLSVPFMVLRYKAAKRIALFEEQFPEAIDLMARALRAGHALTTSLQLVGEEVPEPVGSEFRQLFEQQNYGLSLPDALKEFARRVPLLDARFFVTALLTQRETGGNLSEVLDNLASVIRERFKVKRQVRVMSAHGRITGWALGLLPPGVAIILFVIAPEQMRLLVDDPLGTYMIAAAVVLQVIGVLAIRKIVNVEY